MALPYDLIFRGGVDDSEINACGLNLAYMRFLMAVIDFPYVFKDEDQQRVSLSDSERQLIESGNAALSRLIINGGCNVAKVVFTGTLPNGQVVVPNDTTSISLIPGTLDGEFVSWDSQVARMTFVKDGIYIFQCAIRVNANTTPAGEFRHILYASNELGQAMDADERTRVRIFETCRLTLCMFRPVNTGFGLRYFHNHTFNVELYSQNTFLRVVYLG